MNTFFELIGFFGGALGFFRFIPQAVKVYKTKSAKDLSMIAYLCAFCCNVCLGIYGFYFHRPAVWVTDWIASIFIGTIIILKHKYDAKV
jgi:MtN3 and saliva related transmembrane protein